MSLNIGKFICNHKVLCGVSLGLAIPIYCISHWLGRAIIHLKKCFGTASKVERVFQQVKNLVNSLSNPISQNNNDKALPFLFNEQIIKGAKRLYKSGIRGTVDLCKFNCLVYALFAKNSNFNISFVVEKFQEIGSHTPHSGSLFGFPSDSFKEKWIYGVVSEPKDACLAVKKLLDINQYREVQNLPLFSKLFIPFMCQGLVAHGILAVIELDFNKNVTITIINPMGDNTSYRSIEDDLASSIKQVFPPQYRISGIVHNTKIQQTDGYSCGFQQVRNIQDCQGLDSVYKHVREGKLSTQKRDLDSMEQWFENVIKPKLASILNDKTVH